MTKGVEFTGAANQERLRMDLQMFAEEPPATEEPTSSEEPTTEEPTSSEEKDTTKAFAARLGHERKKIESEYAPYRSVIEKQAKAAGMDAKEYLEYLSEQQEQEELEAEAEEQGKTPAEIKIAREKAQAEEKLRQYERKEKMTQEEQQLTSDPKIGTFVTDNLGRMREIADSADVSLQVALAMVAAEKLPDLMEMTKPEIHVKNYLESLKRGGKPVEIGGGASTPSATPAKTFEDARKSALEKLRKG